MYHTICTIRIYVYLYTIYIYIHRWIHVGMTCMDMDLHSSKDSCIQRTAIWHHENISIGRWFSRETWYFLTALQLRCCSNQCVPPLMKAWLGLWYMYTCIYVHHTSFTNLSSPVHSSYTQRWFPSRRNIIPSGIKDGLLWDFANGANRVSFLVQPSHFWLVASPCISRFIPLLWPASHMCRVKTITHQKPVTRCIFSQAGPLR